MTEPRVDANSPRNETMTPRNDMSKDSMVKNSDRNFLEKAAKSGMKEVTVSQAVLANLTHPQVREYAQMMAADHADANAQLMALAARKGVTLPAKDMKIDKIDDKWSKKTTKLDENYLEEMISDHKDAVDLFEKASKSDDAEIAAFAQKTLPTLRSHLEKARELEKTVD